jgi:hypothetical protein
MVLVGTLAGVAALIAGYPVYGGQALQYVAAAVILLAVASARRLPPARLTPRDVLLLGRACRGRHGGLQRLRHRSHPGRQPGHGGHGRRRGAGRPRDRRPGAHRIRRPAPPSPRVAAAAGVIVAGAALTTGLGTGSLRGLLFATGALACEAAFPLLAIPLLPKLGPIRVFGHAATAAVPIALAAAAIADGPACSACPPPPRQPAWPTSPWWSASARSSCGTPRCPGSAPTGPACSPAWSQSAPSPQPSRSASATPPAPTSPAPLWSPPGSSSG